MTSELTARGIEIGLLKARLAKAERLIKKMLWELRHKEDVTLLTEYEVQNFLQEKKR